MCDARRLHGEGSKRKPFLMVKDENSNSNLDAFYKAISGAVGHTLKDYKINGEFRDDTVCNLGGKTITNFTVYLS